MIMRQALFGQNVYTRHHLCARKKLSECHVVVCVDLATCEIVEKIVVVWLLLGISLHSVNLSSIVSGV